MQRNLVIYEGKLENGIQKRKMNLEESSELGDVQNKPYMLCLSTNF